MTVAEYNQSVDLYSDNVYRFVLKNLKDKDGSRDIVQDVYEKLWLKRETVSFEKVKSYLFTAAHHTMIDTIRKDKRMEGLGEEEYLQPVHNEQYSDLQEVLHEALDKLPAVQKSVILLRDYEGYDYNEIGKITGLNESQVKVYIYRARIFLKNYIGSMDAVI
jgi:RNA polymerase sigma factor (sigma-70 family)